MKTIKTTTNKGGKALTKNGGKPLAFAILTLLNAPIATANEQLQTFHIPPQSLSGALNDYAEAANLQLSYPASQAAGLRSNGIDGDYAPEQALRHLLAGTGLSAKLTANGTVTLEKRTGLLKVADTGQPPSETTLEKVTVEADAVAGYDPEYDHDPYNSEYKRSHASTATKTNTPLMETPLSVQVIPRQVMKDQQAINMGDVVKNVSGIQYSNSYTSYENFIIRGFKTDYDGTSILRNGLRRGANSYELANIEQVEVLKGPASIMYGRVEPGGVVNFVTKMPLSTPYYSLQQQFGSYDLYRTTIDATGPLNDDKTLLYRLNFAGQEYAGFRDFLGHDRIFVAPTLTWKPSDSTQFNVEFEYKRDTGFFSDQGIPALGNGSRSVAPVAKNFSVGEAWAKDAIDSFVGAFNWSHKFNDNWSIRNGFLADLTYYRFVDLGADSYVQDAQGNATSVVRRWVYDANQSRRRYATNFDILGKFDAFGMEHSTLLGFDYYNFSAPKDDTFFAVLPDAYNIDLFNPVHGAPRPTLPEHNAHFDSFYDWYGLYFQDQAAMFDRKLHILFGGRYDWASIKNRFATEADFSDASETRFKDDKFSPRVGIVYRPFNWLSLYGNYTESFGANNGRGLGGAALAPQEATQYEIGLKGEFWDGRVTSSLAYYHLTKSNIPFSSIRNTTLLVGEARSQGVEFDISGQITDQFNLIGSFSYTDAIITRDEDALIGNKLFAVPEFFGSVWGKYDVTNHFSVGTGIYAATNSQGDRANSFDLPGYVRWDAMAAYRFDIGKTKLTAQVNVNNLLDERYYNHTGAFPERMGVTPANPRTVIGSLRLEY